MSTPLPQTPLLHPLAGQVAPAACLIDVDELVRAYFSQQPDPSVAVQRVRFGTSGHRGSAMDVAFNEWHILAIAQAVCDHRSEQGIDGPLFLGIDTHALSLPALTTTLEVLAGNGVHVRVARDGEFTPTPAVSHAILAYNRSVWGAKQGRGHSGLADGVVLTPSHNPPRDGGFKYDPPHGGAAGTEVTGWIGMKANAYLRRGLRGVRRRALTTAVRARWIHPHDFLRPYVADLASVIDMPLIRSSGLRLGVDPMGGAGLHYWPAIAEHHGVALSVTNEALDPTFRFMPLDHDGLIRMDPSSPYAMQHLIRAVDRFDLAFACDTDHDRHGIVTRSAGLLAPDHYLAVLMDDLFRHRPAWAASAAIGKTVVSSRMIDRVAARLGRSVVEVPVGFKWFARGLLKGHLGFAGEPSAGASLLRRDGSVWTTDKDGIAAALLSAEIMARAGMDPGVLFGQLSTALGYPVAARRDAPATLAQRTTLATSVPHMGPGDILAGERVVSVLNHAPGNGALIGGYKINTASGWCVVRPSGTEAIYEIHAESFLGEPHLLALLTEGQALVDDHFAAAP